MVMANSESSRSGESVMSNDDLLTEILVRLPVLSLILFKSISKRWNSLIIDYAANLTFRRNLDRHSGLFLEKYSCLKRSGSYEFVPLDIRIPPLADVFTFGPDVEILHSCNGLLLCRSTLSGDLYVYNPSVTNMFKLIPKPDNVTFNHYPVISDGLRLAFDPTKSLHYKVIYGGLVMGGHPLDTWVQMNTYSSEMGNWSLSAHRFPKLSFHLFQHGVYWNDAIYWTTFDDSSHIFKLDIMIEHPVFTALQAPLTLDLKVHFVRKLFVSRGCLLLYGMQNGCSQHFTIFEKRNVCSEWSVKYIVYLDDIIKPFPKTRYKYPYVFCILLGEKEEDSVVVMELDKKVVQYTIASKTVDTISALGPNVNVYYVACFQFIPSFVNV